MGFLFCSQHQTFTQICTMSRFEPIDLTQDSPADVTFLRVVPAPPQQVNLLAAFNAVADAPPAPAPVVVPVQAPVQAAPLVPMVINGVLRNTVPTVNADPPPDFDMDVENLDSEYQAVPAEEQEIEQPERFDDIDSDDEMLLECLIALSSP